MSYSMYIHYKDGREESYPIRLQDKYWLRPRKILSLQFIPEMQNSGNFKRRRDIELLLLEMERLKQYHVDRGITPLVLEVICIDVMIERFKAIHADWDNIERVSF